MMAGAMNWVQAGNNATIALGQLPVHIQLDRLFQGIGGLVDGSHLDRLTSVQPTTRPLTDAAPERVLGIELPGFADPIAGDLMSDHYVRQPDLIAVYERQGTDHLRAQIDWRYDSQRTQVGTISGLHVWISLQTNRLDSRPLLKVVTTLRHTHLMCGSSQWVAAEEIIEQGIADQSGLLFRPTATPAQSLAIFVMPQDVLRCRLSRDAAQSGWHCEHTLLGEHLEKGVIRRAQLAVYPVAREQDESAATELLASFLAGPLPLTV